LIGPDAVENHVRGNKIGVNADGDAALPNAASGIWVWQARDNTIGGATAEARNIISGNTAYGVGLYGLDATGNRVLGNYIGMAADGQTTVGNGWHGVFLDVASNNFIGGSNSGEGNVISGNGNHGVFLRGNELVPYHWSTETGGNGHYYVIARDSTWEQARAVAQPAGGYLASITSQAEQNFINAKVLGGGRARSWPLWIGLTDRGSEDEFYWVSGEPLGYTNWRSGQPETSAEVQPYVVINRGYSINGVKGAWDDAFPTDNYASLIEFDAEPDAARLASALGSARNSVQGNTIGLDATGSWPAPNRGTGVYVENAAANLIGGTAEGARNVISGNDQHGVQIHGSLATLNVIQGNYVGLEASGLQGRGNSWQGISILNAPGNIVGGTALGAGNTISGNGHSGVQVRGWAATDNLVLGNRIGTTAAGTAAVGNAQYGVEIWDAARTAIGGTGTTTGNLISGNDWDGVSVHGGDVPAYAWPAASGGNGHYYLLTGAMTRSAAEAAAVQLGGHLAEINDAAERDFLNNSVTGQYHETFFIGLTDERDEGEFRWTSGAPLTLASWATGEPNNFGLGEDCVEINAFGLGLWNDIHCTAVRRSVIELPSLPDALTLHAVLGAATGNRIRENAIYGNGGLGIDLDNDGVTFNDLDDSEVGPAGLLNFPRLTYVWSGGSTRVAGTLHSAAGQTFTLDFYANQAADPSGFGEGQRFLGSQLVTTDSLGNASFDARLPSATAKGERVTATTTDAAGNTSEFSRATSAAGEAGIVLTSTLVGADQYRLDVFNATAGGVVGFVYGTQRGEYPLEPAGVTLSVSDPVFLGQVVTPLNGRVQALFRVPAAVAGEEFWFQAYEQAPNPHDSHVVAAGASELVSSAPMEPLIAAIATEGEAVTGAGTVQFSVMFRAPVDGVSAGDFELVAGKRVSGARIADIAGGGASYVVTVETGTGDGTLQLNLKDETAIAAATGIDPSLTRRGPFEGEAYVLHTTREDVNLDFAVTPKDALVLINWLNSHGSVIDPDVRPEPHARLYDVNEDGWITPLDVLLVVTFLNRQSWPRGEGEATDEVKSIPGLASESVLATGSSWLPPVIQTGRMPSAGHSLASSSRGTSVPGLWPRRVDPFARQAGGDPPFSWLPDRRFVPAQAFSSGWEAAGEDLEDVLANLASGTPLLQNV
jgi:hypothetical protein